MHNFDLFLTDKGQRKTLFEFPNRGSAVLLYCCCIGAIFRQKRMTKFYQNNVFLILFHSKCIQNKDKLITEALLCKKKKKPIFHIRPGRSCRSFEIYFWLPAKLIFTLGIKVSSEIAPLASVFRSNKSYCIGCFTRGLLFFILFIVHIFFAFYMWLHKPSSYFARM